MPSCMRLPSSAAGPLCAANCPSTISRGVTPLSASAGSDIKVATANAARWRTMDITAARGRTLEVSDLAPGRGAESRWPEGDGINDRFGTADQVRDQVARARADAEAVSGKACSQDEAWHARHLADAGNAIPRAVDVGRPGVRDLGVAKLGQQFDGAAVGLPDRRRVRLRIEDAHPLHRCRCIEAPSRQRFMATSNAFQAARTKVAPALGEHR